MSAIELPNAPSPTSPRAVTIHMSASMYRSTSPHGRTWNVESATPNHQGHTWNVDTMDPPVGGGPAPTGAAALTNGTAANGTATAPSPVAMAASADAGAKDKPSAAPAPPPSPEGLTIFMGAWWVRYFTKWGGLPEAQVDRLAMTDFWGIVCGFIGGWIGIASLSFLTYWYFQDHDSTHTLIIGSFGASAVLVYGAPRSPMAQPRNVIGGHIMSALSGCIVQSFLKTYPAWSSPLAVAGAIVFMTVTKTLHPPGGATALIAVTPSPLIFNLGFLYVVFPAAVGAAILCFWGIVVNNIYNKRSYPTYWW